MVKFSKNNDGWFWYTPCENGVIGSFYEPQNTLLKSIIDYIKWKMNE